MKITHVAISPGSDMTKFTDDELEWAWADADRRMGEALALRDAVVGEMNNRAVRAFHLKEGQK